MYEDCREECIYNLIPRQYAEQERGSRHKSKFRRTVIEDAKKDRKPHRTMGPANVEKPAPDMFLKKHEKEPKLPPNAEQTFRYPDEEVRRPPVPRPSDRPVMGLRTTKNFIHDNAVENIMSVPKRPEKNLVDTRHGDKLALEPSGLEPIYVHKKDFGKTPVYLQKRQEEIQRAQDEYDAYVAEHFKRGAMKQLSEEERQSILCGLKDNWEALQKEYLGLSVVIDTVPKKYHKERLEVEMRQLERDVELLESHKVIYIAN